MQTLEQPNTRIKNIDGVDIHLEAPDANDSSWVGQQEALELLTNAWLILEDDPRPMNPILISRPGLGKTTLASYAAKTLRLPLYMINCTNDMRPEDLLITITPDVNGKYAYRASPLLSAVITGGACILDEANRMGGECWSSLAPLLDHRRYVESKAAGVKIPAHPDFRFVATMNDDEHTEDIPEYIESRLKPVIKLGMPTESELAAIVRANLPTLSESAAISIIRAMDRDKHGRYSVRDVIDVMRYNMRNVALETAVACVMRRAGAGSAYGL